MLQALVDHEYKLMNVFVGRPVCYDACILASFTVFAKGEVGHLVLNRKQCIDGVDVPIVILRDPAYVSFASLANETIHSHWSVINSRAKAIKLPADQASSSCGMCAWSI